MAHLSEIEMRIIRAASRLVERDVPRTAEALATWTDLSVEEVRDRLPRLQKLEQLP